MPRKNNQIEDPALVPMPDFEAAVKKVISVPKETVDTKLAEFQASNKARRDSRKTKPS